MKEKHEPRQCYATWQKDRKERKYSASGGIAFGFYKRWIQNAGIVYGAAFNEKGILTQQKAETLEEARKFRGSKYVQSYNGFSYSEIGKELKKGKKVLFIGTPCQIAGLKAYLGKASDALVTIDLICHGTPPMSYLEEYIKEIAGAEKVDRVSFRGEKDYHMVFYSQDRVVYSQRFRKDLYYTAYLQGIIHRENCYKCLMQNLTALENVELALQICKDPLDAKTVLEEVGLGERMYNFPAQLSGGEQQRVAIARALAKNPKLLLCDEPTGALDYVTGKSILKLLQDTCHKKGMTVIVITHNSALTPMADRIVRIRNGRVAEMIQNENPTPVEEIEW